MRTVATAAALLVLAAPLAAQQAGTPAPDVRAAGPAPAAEPAPIPQRQPVQAPERAHEPALQPEDERLRHAYAAGDGQEAAAAQIGSRSWWYLVAAVAVGVIVAAVIL